MSSQTCNKTYLEQKNTCNSCKYGKDNFIPKIPVLTEYIEVIVEVSGDNMITGETLLDILLVVLTAWVGVDGHPCPDLLLDHQVHVTTADGVPSTDNTSYTQH